MCETKKINRLVPYNPLEKEKIRRKWAKAKAIPRVEPGVLESN